MAIAVTVADGRSLLNGVHSFRGLCRANRMATIRRMTEPSGPTIRVPRWIQLVGLPVGLLVVWMLAGLLGHVLFLFLTSGVIAFLLNPLVRDLQRMRLPRGLAVACVFLLFAAAVALVVLALGSVVVDQTRSATDRIDNYLTVENGAGETGAEQDIDRLQAWLDTHGLERVQIQKQATDWVDNLGAGEISNYTQDAISFAQGAAFSIVVTLFNLVLIVVIAIYMLLDMERLERAIDRRFPPGDGPALTRAHREGARGLRSRTVDPVDGDRAQRRNRDVGARAHRARARRGSLCAALRCVDRGDRGDPLHRPLVVGRFPRRSTHSSCTPSRRSGCWRSSSSSTRSKATSSCRT